MSSATSLFLFPQVRWSSCEREQNTTRRIFLDRQRWWMVEGWEALSSQENRSRKVNLLADNPGDWKRKVGPSHAVQSQLQRVVLARMSFQTYRIKHTSILNMSWPFHIRPGDTVQSVGWVNRGIAPKSAIAEVCWLVGSVALCFPRRCEML